MSHDNTLLLVKQSYKVLSSEVGEEADRRPGWIKFTNALAQNHPPSSGEVKIHTNEEVDTSNVFT